MLRIFYLILLALAVLISGAIWFYAYGWLGSIGDPAVASAGYSYHSSFGWNFLWLSFLVLTVLSFVLLLKEEIKWAIWVSFAYFAVGLTGLLANDSSYKSFLEANSFANNTTLLNPFFVGIIVVVLVIALLASQLLLAGLIKKKKKVKKADPNLVEEETSE
jgi:hypothetical protein